MTLTDEAFIAYEKEMKRKPKAFVRVVNEKNYPELQIAGKNYAVGGFKATYAEAKAIADNAVQAMEANIDSFIQDHIIVMEWQEAEG